MGQQDPIEFYLIYKLMNLKRKSIYLLNFFLPK